MKKTFYRVNHERTRQGLWYTFNGKFTGLIHDEFSFCKNSALKMDYDPKIVGYVSAVETLEQLYHWFTKEDILQLQIRGWYIYEYQSDDYKWYERFQHYVVQRSSLQNARKIVLSSNPERSPMKTYPIPDDVRKRIENNHTYHPPFGDQVERYGYLREKFKELALEVASVAPASRELSLALTNLQDAQMWTNAAIACNEVPDGVTIT